jgi:hypothetical protein
MPPHFGRTLFQDPETELPILFRKSPAAEPDRGRLESAGAKINALTALPFSGIRIVVK